jgi:hypothetical protein
VKRKHILGIAAGLTLGDFALGPWVAAFFAKKAPEALALPAVAEAAPPEVISPEVFWKKAFLCACLFRRCRATKSFCWLLRGPPLPSGPVRTLSRDLESFNNIIGINECVGLLSQ